MMFKRIRIGATPLLPYGNIEPGLNQVRCNVWLTACRGFHSLSDWWQIGVAGVFNLYKIKDDEENSNLNTDTCAVVDDDSPTISAVVRPAGNDVDAGTAHR